MRSFVPGYDQDVFVSYAHVDDGAYFDSTRPDESTGWVATFVRYLKQELAEKVGRTDAFTVWFDTNNLRGNDTVSAAITTKLERAANFVAILSPPYLASRWCRDEAHFFTERFAADLGGRVFIVEKAPVDDNALIPLELTGRRNYRFWYPDRNEQPRTLGKPAPQRDEIQYFRLIEDLARDLHSQMKTMAEGPPNKQPSAGSAANGGTVFVAEVTDDLEFHRLELCRYLEQQHALVLPEKTYPLGRAEFEAALDSDLARSKVFAQLLGPIPGKMPSDVLEGYGWLQFERARRQGMQVLQWRSPELDLAGIKWPRHRGLLELETVHATSLETFKKLVGAALAPLPPSARPCGTGDQPLVFLNTEQRHRDIAAKVCAVIGDRAAWAEPLRAGSADEVRVDLEQNLISCDAMVMVHADNVGWARAQLRAFKKLAPRREHPVRTILVIDVPADPKPELDFYLPQLVIVDGRGDIGREVSARLAAALQL